MSILKFIKLSSVTHVYSVHVEGKVADADGQLEAPKLHLQHAVEAPAHEGCVREP